jgi:anaerobic magnesium-protoporphyrin IX monomethyl ester cyclase
MRILLINVPHPAIGSRIPDDHLPPLGLLAIGGPLIDDGHGVKLIDGEFGPMPTSAIVAEAARFSPHAVLFGHSGSTSGHPVIAEVAKAISLALPYTRIIYGGVFPTYHWREILRDEPYVTAIVRGEGEETVRRLMAALKNGDSLDDVAGIAYRDARGPRATRPASVIRDLDAYRVGWELIDHARYSYWGGYRAVVVQFSRGCPHLCNYCGQRGFWTRWRHRDPVLFAKELARLHREHGVKVINFADENPTVSKKAWRLFLEALIAENVDLILVGSTRADDIVRDADILHLYKKAGWARFLLGLESTDEKTLALIRKGAATSTDREAIRLMRRHGILSMATWVVGFEEETDRDHWRGLRQLLSLDPDRSRCSMSRRTAGRRISSSRLSAGSSKPTSAGGTISIRCWRRATCRRGACCSGSNSPKWCCRRGRKRSPASSSTATRVFVRRCAGTPKWDGGCGLTNCATSSSAIAA